MVGEGVAAANWNIEGHCEDEEGEAGEGKWEVSGERREVRGEK